MIFIVKRAKTQKWENIMEEEEQGMKIWCEFSVDLSKAFTLMEPDFC